VLNLAGLLTPLFVQTLQDGTERNFVPAAEAGWRLAQAGLADSSLLVLPRNPALGLNLFVALVASGVLDLKTPRQVFGGPIVPQYASTESYTLPEGTNIQAAFSRMEQALYLVGGARDSYALGLLARMNLASGETTYLSTEGGVAPSSTVLDVTYDQPRGRLYVLDVADEVVFGQRKARLTRYDVATGAGKVLMTWPYTQCFCAAYLAVSDSGDVMLVVDATLAYTAWRIRVDGDVASFSGVATGIGTVLGKPEMGEYEPVLPVWRLGSLAVDTLGPSAFIGSGTCLTL
jgi:hypothetical protein